MDEMEKKKFIFGSLFLLANRLQVIGDQYLGQDGMTTKQWFLTVIISQFPHEPPTLGEVSALMGSSRQNVKQLALKLQEKGFLRIEKDVQDARVLRLVLTQKSRDFWEQRQEQDHRYVAELFSDLDESQVDVLWSSFQLLLGRIEQMEKMINQKEDGL